jgi:hypothetical protein
VQWLAVCKDGLISEVAVVSMAGRRVPLCPLTEVGELDGALLVHQQVPPLDVAVDDAVLVEVHQACLAPPKNP